MKENVVQSQVAEKEKVPKPLWFQDFSGEAHQIRTGNRVPRGRAPWEPSDLTIKKRIKPPVMRWKTKVTLTLLKLSLLVDAFLDENPFERREEELLLQIGRASCRERV